MSRPLARTYEPVPPESFENVKEGLRQVMGELRRRLGVRLTLDESNSRVLIEAEGEGDAANVLRARDIVRAIAIGFSPQDALQLLDEDYVLVVVDVRQAVGDKENHLRRVLGRVIGENGRARRTLEEITGTRIVVNDRGLVGIIGDYERSQIAKHGVELLVQGRMHATVYRRLESMMRELKRRESTELWFSKKGEGSQTS
ncbi:MAG: KH domain-containing protein [Acidilobus sp.]|jgi:ribosomal RNA assembly protein|nr:KH domain-containing protein [Acidilobus sp.]MCG2889542.1 KH domain-containing protein [Acidilobus sp.]MCG2891097.1 KH domain-containing protein [Acidilobus sp.]